MYIMSSTPFTCCSIGAATVSETVRAFAPGYTADTSIVGGVMSGYCATGSDVSATDPASVTMMLITLAKIGRSMKKRVNIGGQSGVGSQGSVVRQPPRSRDAQRG